MPIPRIGVDREYMYHSGRSWGFRTRRLRHIPTNTDNVIYDTWGMREETLILFKGYWAIKFNQLESYYIATKRKDIAIHYYRYVRFIDSSIIQL